MSRSYAIIGTGAIGGYCAVKLHNAGFNVHCLARSNYEAIKANGLTVITATNQAELARVYVYNDVAQMPACDVILVTLKTTENQSLATILPILVSKNPGAIVAVLQNGISMEQEISRYIDPSKIIGGYFIVKVSREQPHIIRHHNFNKVCCAQYYPDYQGEGQSLTVTQLVADFKQAQFDSEAHTHLLTLRWRKLIDNIPFNGLSALYNMDSVSLLNNFTTGQLYWQLFMEVVTAAKKCGAQLSDDVYTQQLTRLDKYRNQRMGSSMQDDFVAGRPLELQAIYANAIAFAARFDASMPLTQRLYEDLQYYSQ